MSDMLKKMGDYVYKNAQTQPKKVLRLLTFGYGAFGKWCKHNSKEPFLPARLYVNWLGSDETVRSLKHPEKSALVNIFTPCEILRAMDIHTLFPEAAACCLAFVKGEKIFIESAEADGIPATLCSYHKCLIGLAETGVMGKPMCIINTTMACDANQVSFRRVAEHYGVNHFVIDVPSHKTDENLEYVASQLRELVGFVEENSGKKLDEEKFRQAIIHSKNTVNNYLKYLELRADRYFPDNMTSEMLSVFITHVLLGSAEAEKFSQDLVKQVEALPPVLKGVRVLWVHTLPYWQEPLRELLNLNERCEVVACDMTFDSLVGTDEEDPYRYMASRVINNTFNGTSDRRIELAAEYAKKLHADGVVWYCHWGCKQTAGASAAARKYMEERGIPVLVLDGDGCDTSNVNDGQTATRMEAFIELLEERKGGTAK